jgi:hypothetical protein
VAGGVSVYPQLIVEAGFVPTDPAAGNLTLLLDDGAQGLLDTDELADTDTWTDITPYVQSGTVSRPYTRQQGPLTFYQSGTASFVLNNGDGRFSPWNLAGPYVAAGATQVRPMIPVRVRAIWNGSSYYLWQGFATSWVPPAVNWGSQYDQTTLTCQDAFYALTNITLPTAGAAGAGELSGARISRILTAAGWYASSRGMSVIDTGEAAVQAYTGGDTALNLLQVTTDSEIGELYMDAQGRVRFRGRDGILTETRSNTVQCVFGDAAGTAEADGTEQAYTLVSSPDDDTTMANDIQATIVGSSNLQEVQDAAAVAKYLFPRTYQRSDLVLTTDASALAWADYVLYLSAADEARFDQLTVSPRRDPVNLWPQVLGRDLGDRIQVWRRPPGVTAFSVDCFIRGITHTFAATDQSWQTVWDLQAADRYSFFVLDNATLGQLDDNALAW